MLTIAKLKKMKPHTIFDTGIGLIEHPWSNDAKPVSEGGTLLADGRSTRVRWVAVRGGTYDWCLFHSMDANFIKEDFLDSYYEAHLNVSKQRIADLGAKIHRENEIKKLVPCDDESFKMYRH